MNSNDKKVYSQYVGLGLILGVAIGSALDFIFAPFTGTTAALGSGLGIVVGSVVGHLMTNKLD